MSFFFLFISTAVQVPPGYCAHVCTWYVVWYRYYSSTGLTRWCTRTMNAWDVWFRFVHVIFGIPFVQWYPSWAFLFFFPVKSPLLPSTLKSTQYSTFLLLLFLLSTRVCVCARYCTYMKLHIHVCMYYVPRATYLLASCTDMCAHNTAVQNIVTCYCYLLRQCKLFTEAVEVCTCTQRLPLTVPHTADAPLRLRIAHRLQF